MGVDTKIQWCDHTFNPWIGCAKVSPGCANCYAETLMDRRWGKVKWGKNGTRNRTSPSNWREPFAWDKAAAADGVRRRVFCASLADVFEDRDQLKPWRKQLFDLITRTPNLDWLVLTKRPENALRMMVESGLYAVANPSLPCPQPNLWIGTSVEDQSRADERIGHLLATPAVVRFLSMEPLLGPVDLSMLHDLCREPSGEVHMRDEYPYRKNYGPPIDWVIVGGESGPGARPCNVDDVRSVVDQCKAAGVAVFVKQLGANVVDHCEECTPWHTGWPAEGGPIDWETGDITLKDKKGGDMDEWPEYLHVREFPTTPR